jgi:hypothetical protein
MNEVEAYASLSNFIKTDFEIKNPIRNTMTYACLSSDFV